jgi:hypothetical protein
MGIDSSAQTCVNLSRCRELRCAPVRGVPSVAVAVGQRAWISRMVRATDPSRARAGSNPVSQGRNRSGTSSSGTKVHSPQMNLAW